MHASTAKRVTTATLPLKAVGVSMFVSIPSWQLGSFLFTKWSKLCFCQVNLVSPSGACCCSSSRVHVWLSRHAPSGLFIPWRMWVQPAQRPMSLQIKRGGPELRPLRSGHLEHHQRDGLPAMRLRPRPLVWLLLQRGKSGTRWKPKPAAALVSYPATWWIAEGRILSLSKTVCCQFSRACSKRNPLREKLSVSQSVWPMELLGV